MARIKVVLMILYIDSFSKIYKKLKSPVIRALSGINLNKPDNCHVFEKAVSMIPGVFINCRQYLIAETTYRKPYEKSCSRH
jgi:hypothetical protein